MQILYRNKISFILDKNYNKLVYNIEFNTSFLQRIIKIQYIELNHLNFNNTFNGLHKLFTQENLSKKVILSC